MAQLFLFLMGMAPPDVLEGYLLISQVHSSKKSCIFAVSNLKSVAFLYKYLKLCHFPSTAPPCRMET